MAQKQKIILDDWQREFLNYKGHSLTKTGRRVGKTYIHARKACKRMIEKPNTRVIVASLTEDQAQLIIMFALNHLEQNHNNLLNKKHTHTNSKKITLKNNSTIIARPVGNTGDAIRGFEADVLILDEVSRFNELILEAATPVLATTGGEIWMCSTPFGKRGYFWRAYQNKEDRYKIFEISTEYVFYNRPIGPSWTEEQREKAIKYLEEEKQDKSELQYGQEYLGLFLDDLRRFYSDEWIEKVCIMKRKEIIPKYDNVMGCDLARMGGDATTYEILHLSNSNKAYHIGHHLERYKLTTHTEDRIVDLTNFYNCGKVGIDAGAGTLGVSIFDHLIKIPYMKSKLTAMNNRSIALDRDGKKTQRIMNEDFHDNLKAMGEHGDIYLLDDDEIKNSFRNIQIEITDEENKQSKVKIYGKDSHIVEGIKRAAWLAKEKKLNNLNITYM